MQKCPRNAEPGVKGSGGGRAIPSPVQSLAGHTLGITQISEPGTVCGTGSRVPLGIKADISFGCCAVNLGQDTAVCLGRDGGTEEFFTPCPISALLAPGRVEAARLWEEKQQPGTYGSGSRVSFFFFSN